MVNLPATFLAGGRNNHRDQAALAERLADHKPDTAFHHLAAAFLFWGPMIVTRIGDHSPAHFFFGQASISAFNALSASIVSASGLGALCL